MTKNNTMLVLGLFILIVNLVMGEDGVISRMASNAHAHLVADGAAEQVPEAQDPASAGEVWPVSASTGNISPSPEPSPAPQADEPLPELSAPRVELLLAE